MICHIALAEAWDEAQRDGEYRWSTQHLTIDEVGFLHASDSYEQAWRVVRYIFDEVDEELVLLDLDRDAIVASGLTIVMEPNSEQDPGSECFPHVYGGNLPVSCVSQVRRFAGTHDLLDALISYQAAGSPPGRRDPEAADA